MKLTNCERAVLKHIKFWHPKSKTKFDGKKWVIQTCEEIREHLANSELHFAEDTIRKAVKSLGRKGYVETIRKPHRFKTELIAVNWISLTEKCHSEPAENAAPNKQKMPLPSGKKCRFYITENITENIQKLYQGEEASSSQEKMGNDMVELPEEKYQGFGSKGKGAKAILDKFNKVKSETDLRIYPCTPITFFNFYKSVYAKHHGYIGEVSNPVLI